MAVPPTPEASPLLMLDPSFFLSEEGLRWLEQDSAARSRVAVPASLMDWVRGSADALSPTSLVAQEDLPAVDQRRQRLSAALSDAQAFSYLDVWPSPEAEAVQEALLALDQPTATVR